MPTAAPTPLPYVVTGAISFSGVSLEEARAERRVFLRTLAILLGVDESWVRVAIRRARRSRRRLDASYAPTTAPTREMPTPAPSLTPTATAASEPTAADGFSLAPTAAGVSLDYNVSVPSISEAEAVEAVVETTTPADVDEAVETAATEVEAETGTTITLVDSIATEDISAVEIVADPPGTPGDDDPPTLGLSEADDGASGDGGDGGSGGGGGGGADAAAAGGAAAGAVILLLALGGGMYVYRRRSSKAPAAAEDDVERAISKQLAVPDLLPLHALAPEDVAAWLRRQDLPGDVDGLCTAVVKRDINGATLRDADDASLKELGATLGLRKVLLKLLRAEPPAPRRGYASAPSADEPPPPPPPSWRSGDES